MSLPIQIATNVAIQIGGIPILLRCEALEFREMIQERYAGFFSEQECGPDEEIAQFDVELLPAGEMQNDEEVQVWSDRDLWHLRRGDFRVEWDSKSRRGRIRQELNSYALNSVLRIVHSLILAREGGFLLHASSVIKDGRAYLFSGVSGAGKTTIARLAPPDTTLLTDEISYVRPTTSGYAAWGTPFSGELGRIGENASAPIRTIFFLEQGSENRIEAIDSVTAVRRLLRNILFFSDQSTLVRMVFESACEFIKHVPVRQLTFVPDESAWDLVARAAC